MPGFIEHACMSEAAKSDSALRYIRQAVQNMHGYVPGEQINNATKLNTNECPWPASPAVHEAINAINEKQLRQYPNPSSASLRHAAAERYGCDADQILVGNGSDDCLTILYRSICEAGDQAVCPWPSYGLYDTLAAIQGIQIEHVAYNIGIGDQTCTWTINKNICKSQAKLCLIANPNNPSGTFISADEVREIASSFQGVVVIDEAYIDFVGDENDRKGMIQLIEEFDNLVVIRTFSKSYSLAGLRVGLLFANKTLIEQFNKVKDSYNVNVVSQVAAEAALRDTDYHQELVNRVLDSRNYLEDAFKNFGWFWPKSEANFLMCYVGEHAQHIQNALKQRGILIRWWDNEDLRHYLRITAGTAEENATLIEALQDILS